MTANSQIKTATVTIQSQGQGIPAYLAQPGASTGGPAVIVIQEVFGVNAHIRAVTERLAQAGYIAIAPRIYHRQAPGFAVGYSDADLALGRQYKNGTHTVELLSDIQGSIDYVKEHVTEGRSAAVGCMGFCFGGHVAYLAATLPAVQATASFYGAGICQFSPGGGEPTLNRTADIQGTIYAFFGMQDPLIPQEDVDKIEATLTKHQISHRIFRYPDATHGFFCDRRDSYQSSAAEDAWAHVMDLFQHHLSS